MALPICLLLAGWIVIRALADEKAPQIIQINVNQLGPQRLGPLPPVVSPPGNPTSSLKIHLGKELYFDPRLSADGTVSCASCHNPALGWSDAGPTSKGIRGQIGGRRAPPVSNAAYSPLQFWDGRSPIARRTGQGPDPEPHRNGKYPSSHDANRVQNLRDMRRSSRRSSEKGRSPSDQVAEAIAAFERTVVTTDSRSTDTSAASRMP